MASTSARTRASGIRDLLENAILTEVHSAGERLDEQEIANRFGVSRTPVREALRQLASTGLVDLVPNRGAFVRHVSMNDLVQMFEVMAGLEGMAGRLAARRASPAALTRIRAALRDCELAEEASDPDAYYIRNSVFHEAIYHASGNAFLAEEAMRLHQRLRGFRRLQLRAPRRISQSVAEHRRICAAIAGGDERAAEAELKDHVTIQGERFGDVVAALSQRGRR